MTIAQTILQQLGGNKFLMMTGAKVFSDGKNQETLIVKFTGSKAANMLNITLTSMDLYTMKFFKYRNMQLKEVATHEMVYDDMLQSLFTKETGLYTSL